MLIHLSRKVTGSILELSVDGSQVEQVRSFKFLGVAITDTLTWSDHINTVCAKVSRNLNLTFSLSLPTETLSGPGAPCPSLSG